MEKKQYKEMHDVIIEECGRALDAIDADDVLRYIGMIQSAEKVFFVGVGRVLLSLEAMAKRYAHLGIRAVIVGEITEPAITPRDVLVVGSGSG